jgi:hypothetical protein
VGFDQQQLASVILLTGISGSVHQEPLQHRGCDLRKIANLQGHNPAELTGRVGDEIGKIAVQRQQDCAELLGLGNDHGIWRFRWHVVLQTQHFMFRRPKGVHNLI